MRTAGAIVLGLVVFAMTCAHAGTTGKVAGKVLDAQTGEPLVGVNVLLVGTTLGASSDIDGEYFILNIPPGTYAVKASAVGYGPVTVNCRPGDRRPDDACPVLPASRRPWRSRTSS